MANDTTKAAVTKIHLGFSDGNQVGVMVYARPFDSTEWQAVDLVRWNGDINATARDWQRHAVRQGFDVLGVYHNVQA
jgi:hypothetical protein